MLKQFTAFLCAFVLSAQLIPAVAFAQGTKVDSSRATIEELLAAGEYAEGEALALIRAGSKPDVSGEANELAEVGADAVELAAQGAKSSQEAADEEAAKRVAAADADDYTVQHVVDHSRTTEQILRDLYKDPNVIAAEPNYIVEAASLDGQASASDDGAARATAALASSSARLANDASGNPGDLTNTQWYADKTLNTYATTPLSPTNGYSMNVPGWKDNRNGDAVKNASGTVCIMDTGVDLEHPDLKDVVYHFTEEQQQQYGCGEYGYNASGDDYDVALKEPYLVGMHGTHVAGIVAAKWNDFGVSGVANGCKIFSVNVFGGSLGNTMVISSVAKGFEFLADVAPEVNLKAVNCSWGTAQMHFILNVMINKLGERGANTVIASGNLHNDMDETIDVSSSVNSPYAVVVDAASPDGKATDFTCYGQNSTDVFAPGAQIMSTVSRAIETEDMHQKYMYFHPEATAPENLVSNPGIEKFAGAPGVKFFDKNPVLDLEAKEIGAKTEAIGYSDSACYAMNVKQITTEEDTGHGFSNIKSAAYMAIPVDTAKAAKWVALSCAMSDAYKPSGGIQSVMYASESGGAPIEVGVSASSNAKAGWEVPASSSVYQCHWANLSFSIDGMAKAYNEANEDTKVSGAYLWRPDGESGTAYLVAKVGFSILSSDATPASDTTFYVDDVSVGGENAFTGAYAYMSGTSMAAPAVTGCLAVAAQGESDLSTLDADQLKNAALERKAKLLAAVEYDDDLAKLCRTGGRVNLEKNIGFTKKAPLITRTQLNGDTLTVEGLYFGDSGELYVDNNKVTVSTWSAEAIAADISKMQLKNGSHVVAVKSSDGIQMQAAFSYSSAEADGLPLYENELALPTSLDAFGSAERLYGPVVACGDSIFAFSVTGGNGTTQGMWRYDISKNTWSACTLPSGFNKGEWLTQPRATAFNGKLYLYGYYEEEDEGERCVWRYDSDQGTWTKLDVAVPVGASGICAIGSSLFFAFADLNQSDEESGGEDSGQDSYDDELGEGTTLTSGFIRFDPDSSGKETWNLVGGDYVPYDIETVNVICSNAAAYVYGKVAEDALDREAPYGLLYRFAYDESKNEMKCVDLSDALVGVAPKIVASNDAGGAKAHVAFAGLPDGIAIVGSDTNGQDTHILRDAATKAEPFDHTSCYHTAFDPSAVYANGNLYAMGYNATEPDVMYFRSTHAHSWGAPQWEWAKDYSSATMKIACSHDASHAESATASVSSKVVKEATCDVGGNVEYTASAKLGESSFSDVKTIDTPALGHDWGEGVVTTAPQAGKPGVRTYTCSRCKQTKAEEIPATPEAEAVVGEAAVVGGSAYEVTSNTENTVTFTKAKKAKSVTVPATVEIKGKAYKVTKVAKKAFAPAKGKLKKVTIGKNVASIGAQAFKGCKKLKTIIVKSKKLTKKGVKGSLKGSKVKTVKVKVGSKKVNKKYVKKYKKIFTKKNCGKKATVKL